MVNCNVFVFHGPTLFVHAYQFRIDVKMQYIKLLILIYNDQIE